MTSVWSMFEVCNAGSQDAALPWRPHSDADQHESEGLFAAKGGDPGDQWGGLQGCQELQVRLPLPSKTHKHSIQNLLLKQVETAAESIVVFHRLLS